MARTSRPTRRSTSDSVRTAVVLPVPPFSDRTVIVSAIEGEHDIARPWARPLLGGDRGLDGRPDGRGIHEIQRVTADRDLVAVAQRAPLHAPPVDVDAVQRAVVEHADALRLVDDERVAARDGGVV